jgi:hypothetical protein
LGTTLSGNRASFSELNLENLRKFLFQHFNFFAGQFLELLFAGALREFAFSLAQEPAKAMPISVMAIP